MEEFKMTNYSDNEDFLNDMVRDYVPEKAIINFVKAKKTSNGLELRYNRKEQLWELCGYYYWSLFGEKHEPKFDVIESNNPIDYLIDDTDNLSNIPIEVKSGKDYTIHSALDKFLSNDEYNIKKAYVLSNEKKVYVENGIIYMPIYYVMFLQNISNVVEEFLD